MLLLGSSDELLAVLHIDGGREKVCYMTAVEVVNRSVLQHILGLVLGQLDGCDVAVIVKVAHQSAKIVP